MTVDQVSLLENSTEQPDQVSQKDNTRTQRQKYKFKTTKAND